jgi:hypothetical protein
MRRDPLTAGAAALTALAFAGSYSHTQHVVAVNGQDGWISWATAAMPEAAVLLVVLRRVRDGRLDLSGWVVGATAAAFTISANLATAMPTIWGWVVAGWPAWAAIGATILAHGTTPQGRESPVDDEDAPAPTLLPVAPDPEPARKPASAAAAATPRPQVVEAVITTAPSGRGLSDDDLHQRLLEAIRTRVLPPAPSAEQIRLHLGIAWKRGAALKARLDAEGAS